MQAHRQLTSTEILLISAMGFTLSGPDLYSYCDPTCVFCIFFFGIIDLSCQISVHYNSFIALRQPGDVFPKYVFGKELLFCHN